MAPVQSWGEAALRALQAPIGGFLQSQRRRDYQAQDDSYRQGLAKVLQSPDPIAALQASTDPTLQGMGLQQGLDLTKAERTARLQLANELMGKGLKLNPDGTVSPVSGYGTAVGGIKNEETMASIPGEVAKGKAMIPVEVQKQSALIPGEVSKATQVAQATAPIDAAKEIGVYNSTQGPQKKIENTEKLADDFHQDKNVQAYQTMVPVYKSMVDAAGRNTRAADLNLVYGMAKLFDPTSVVREGEQVLVKDTASLPSELIGMINKLNGGQALQPDTRRSLLTEASSRVKQAEDLYNKTKDFYANRATQQGVDPNQVFFDIGGTPDAPGSAGGPQGPRVLRYNPTTKQMEPAQ
jgi:hypothetical protein